MIRVGQVVHRKEGRETLGKVVKLMEPGLVVIRPPHVKYTNVFVEQDIQEHYEKSRK